MSFLEYCLAFSFGFVTCLFIEEIHGMFEFTKRKKKWDELKKIEFRFSTEDYKLVYPIQLEHLVRISVPKIIELKAEQLDFQDIMIESGTYDLSFTLDIGWKKK